MPMARDDAFHIGGVPIAQPVLSQGDVVAAAKNAAAKAASYRTEFGFEGASERPKNENGQDVLTVSEVTRLANSILKKHSFCVKGEVSELSDKPGWKAVYFTIKEADAVLECKMWRNRYSASGVQLAIGAEVVITGKFDIYARTGRISFDATSISIEGEGALRARIAALAKKLQAEGLMAQERKRPIPKMPLSVGIVSSPRGAVIHDALRTFRRRFPMARIVFAGVPVEGVGAERELTRAVQAVGSSGVEVVLLIRGGGSFESFMPFNDEGLARAIVACPVPVVTGIGHEPDTSIADMVADHRASTPTDAALFVTPDRVEVAEQLNALFSRMTRSLKGRLDRSEQYLDQVESRPLFQDPALLYSNEAQSLDLLQGRLEQALRGAVGAQGQQLQLLQERFGHAGEKLGGTESQSLGILQERFSHAGQKLATRPLHDVELMREKLLQMGRGMLGKSASEAAVLTARLNDLSPLHILERGWSIARDEQGSVVSSVSQAPVGSTVELQLTDGALSCRVEGQTESELTELLSLEETHE